MHCILYSNWNQTFGHQLWMEAVGWLLHMCTCGWDSCRSHFLTCFSYCIVWPESLFVVWYCIMLSFYYVLPHHKVERASAFIVSFTSSSSHMHFMSHNWSATKQRLHPQSVAEISRHSASWGDRIRQCETSSGSHHKDTDQCLSVAISSAGTAVSLFRAKTVKQRPLLPREVETRLPDCGVTH